jgi:hypothetical protein
MQTALRVGSVFIRTTFYFPCNCGTVCMPGNILVRFVINLTELMMRKSNVAEIMKIFSLFCKLEAKTLLRVICCETLWGHRYFHFILS